MAIKNQSVVKLCADNFSRNNIPIDKKYQYEILQEKHIDGVVDLFTHAFCDDEPMTHYLKMKYGPYTEFTRIVTENAVKDGYSVVALDKGKVIACALSEDLSNAHDIPIDFDPNFKYIISLLETLGGGFFENKKFEKNLIMHLFITAVAKDYRHLGLSTQINFRAMDLAAQKNFKFVYCELTNIWNEKGIMDHMGNKKKLIGSCVYQDFISEGKKPFAHLSGAANSYLWEIAGDNKLVYLKDDEKCVDEI